MRRGFDDPQALLVAAAFDPEAFGGFYLLFERSVLGFFVRATGRAEVAGDLTAETFARALECVESYDVSRGEPAQWLFGIARNVLRSSYRAGRVERDARRRLGMPQLTFDDHATEAIERLTVEDRVTPALELLPKEQQHAIYARVVEGYEYEEIAGELCCSEAVARQRVSRGLRTLRARLVGQV